MQGKKTSIIKEEKVVTALAQGNSYSKAMETANISSKGTIHNIKQRRLNDIERLREEYVQIIDESGGGLKERAEVVGSMVRANKIITLNGRSVEYPDWRARLKAIEYIDKLKGISAEKKEDTQINYNPYTFFNVPKNRATSLKQAFKEAVDSVNS